MKYLQVFLLLFVLTIFVNCTPRVIPVENVRVDSVKVVQVHRDTIYEKDSTTVYLVGDTVYNTRYRYIYRDRLVGDTLIRVQRDTITRVVRVEKELSRLEKLKLNIGNGVLWALPIILGLWVFYRKFIK